MQFGLTFINYNNSGYTRKLLDSLSRIEPPEAFQVVIVDNASTDAERDRLVAMCKGRPNVSLHLNDRNVGYFAGLNCGIAELRRLHPELEYIVVGNNDLEFPPDFLRSILDKPDVFQSHAVVAPNIVGPDGVPQNPHVIRPIGWTRELIYDLYFSNYQMARLIQAAARASSRFTRRKDHESHATPMTIHQGYGACYILGPVFLRHFTQLWAPTFLMGEEYFLAKQLEDRNLTQFYEPSIQVYHHGHATTGAVPRRELWEIARASHKVYRQYKPRF